MLALLGVLASAHAAPRIDERPAVRSVSYDLPLTFEVNKGQTDARVDFLARGQGYTLFLTPTEAVFALTPPRTGSKRSGNGRESPQPDRTVMRMQLIDSAPDPRVQGLDELPGKVNYFRGNDSSKWRANVSTVKRVRYTSVYPGVDLIYYGQPQQLEYDFIVAPGADPSAIKLAFAGVEDATVDARGDLVLKTSGGPLRFQRPLIYQMRGERRHTVDGSYMQMRSREIGFQVGAYDRTRPLIIDPVLSYSTFLGGSDLDEGREIAVDATGAAYLTGSTLSTDFPTTNALQPAHGVIVNPALPSSADAFVAKLTPDGTALVYATYLGGNDEDIAFGIAVDPSGAASISGLTRSTDFPTARALQPAKNLGSDAFVAKISADGSQLIYSTYLGGHDHDSSAAIAVDLAGAAYITGETSSPDFPTTDGFQPECVAVTSQVNAFVAKLPPDGSALVYSTYLGGTDFDSAWDIAVDSTGAAYVTGHTASTDFPTVSPLQPRHGGAYGDAFVTKLAPDGKTLIHSTYLGGNSDDQGRGIAADSSGAAYVTGRTQSSDFPTMNPLQGPIADVSAFVVKLAPEGGSLMYGTYLGACCGGAEGQSIAVDIAGAAYVTGGTGSTNFPIMNPLQTFGGGFDAFVTKLAPDGSAFIYSTYLGGSQDENAWAVAVDLTGAAYVTGFTRSASFPTMQPLQATHGGFIDAFVVKISGGNDLEHFNDLDGAFAVTNGEVRRSEHEGIYTEDRHYITTTRSDYLSSDWVYEVTVRSPSDGPPDILFIGIGSGRPDSTYFNEPANSLMFRIHQGWIDGRVDVAAHPTGPGPNFTYFAEAVGALPADSSRDFTEFTAHIRKVGNTIKFSICRRPSDSEPCEPEFFDEIPDLSAAAPFLSSGNTHLFFGNGSGSYAFTRAAISPGISGSENDGDSGGGSIDGLLVLLLAHFTFMRVARRRLRPGESMMKLDSG